MHRPHHKSILNSCRILAALLAVMILAGPSFAKAGSLLDWLTQRSDGGYVFGWAKGATPYVEVNGIQLLPVYASGDPDEIFHLAGDAMPEGARQAWLVRLQVQNGPFDQADVIAAAQALSLWLYKGDGFEVPSCGVVMDEGSADQVDLMYRWDGEEAFSGVALMYRQKVYPLNELLGMEEAKPVLAPTPTPVPTSPPPRALTEEEKQSFQDELTAYMNRSEDLSSPIHVAGSKVLIVLFSSGQNIVSSSLGVEWGDYHGIPAELLAQSREEADEILYIYRHVRWSGRYTDGARAGVAETEVLVIRDGHYNCRTLVSHDPPHVKTGSGDRTGSYDPWEGLDILAQRILDAEQKK